MYLHTIDWIILVFYLVLTIILGLIFSKKGTQSIQEFFVSGRSLPWWLAGTTMIASAFAIDTPIGIAGMVANYGIPGVWYAWSFVLGGAGMLGAFVFSAMLRRSEILSPAEIAELRYDGKPAAVLRGFKGVYFGILVNAWTLGWILKAVLTLSKAVIPQANPYAVLGIILVFTLAYTAASGLWGIAATDLIQFFIGTIGSLTLAIFAWRHVGGVEQIVKGLCTRYGDVECAQRLSFFPSVASPFFATFAVFITLKWWGNPPPAILQRIIASKDEQHASKATFLFAVVAFGFNYWPMIFVALAALVAYPELTAAQAGTGVGYARLIVEIMPTGILGLMLASLIAAFMSTVDTHINYGASYMVNDLYKRFVAKNASKKHYVRASQVSTMLMLLIAVGIAMIQESVAGAWLTLSMMTAGYGVIMVLRWFWWRINAWSELSALTIAAAGSLVMYVTPLKEMKWAWRFLFVFSASLLSSMIITFFTRPTSREHLAGFCKKVKPFPQLWGPIAKAHPEIEWNPHLVRVVLQWTLGTIALFCFCFGLGHYMFLRFMQGTILLICSTGITLYLFSNKKKYDTADKGGD
ncbi:MAG: hypothetical protein GF401_03850 [Chitinivibrionales bacterium]|nr:hypothetical protein [Chitinivibrionales bacterium]